MAWLRRRPLIAIAFSMAIALLLPGVSLSATGDAPQPIPGGIQIPDGPLIHIFLPGPPTIVLPFSGLQLMGLDVEPSTITDFDGFTALAYLVGTAVDGKGKQFNLEADIRIFRGRYVAEDGSTQRGTFALIWIDLFEPGSGSQVHDFNGGIFPSGLFWTVRLPDSALTVSADGRTARLQVENVPVIDSFVFLGPNQVPATVNLDVTWQAMGAAQQRGLGSSVPPSDPGAFLGTFFDARAVGRLSGSELGFNFRSNLATTDQGWAEMGRERNGAFLP